MYQKSQRKLLKALLFQSQEKNVSIPFQLSVTTISTQLGFSLTARKRQIQWTTKTYSVLKCQYSPLHEFVSGACSRPSSCGIKVFYRKLSRPTFTNKVHIYMQWFSTRMSLNIKIMVKKCQKYPKLIFAVLCKSSRSQMFLKIVVKNFEKFTRKHPESLIKKM